MGRRNLWRPSCRKSQGYYFIPYTFCSEDPLPSTTLEDCEKILLIALAAFASREPSSLSPGWGFISAFLLSWISLQDRAFHSERVLLPYPHPHGGFNFLYSLASDSPFPGNILPAPKSVCGVTVFTAVLNWFFSFSSSGI